MPCHRGGSAYPVGRRPACADRSVHATRSTRPYPVRQRQRVHGHRGTGMTAPGWREDTLHRTRIALGERLQRELQRQTQGRTAERGDLLLNDGGKGADRTMAQALQHHQAAQFAGLQAARASDHRASPRRSALRCREAAAYSPLNRKSKLTAGTKHRGRSGSSACMALYQFKTRSSRTILL